VRDAGLLESALARPQQLAHYGEPPPDVYALAAAYGYGLARNHPFIDGNKRTAFVVMLLFLYLNGYRIEASDADKVMIMLKVAAGQIDETTLANWLREHAMSRHAVHEPKAQYTTRPSKKTNERKV
jgi:death-on-curing protein